MSETDETSSLREPQQAVAVAVEAHTEEHNIVGQDADTRVDTVGGCMHMDTAFEVVDTAPLVVVLSAVVYHEQ